MAKAPPARAGANPPKRKPGRPKGSGTVLTPEVKSEILEILEVGGSRNDAADYVGVARSTLHSANLDKSHKEFSAQVKRAELSGKVHHLRRVHGGGTGWQSSGWFLERKYPDEYGRKYQPPQAETAPDANAVPVRKYVYEITNSPHKRP